MAANQPMVFIEGIDEILKRDINKHSALLVRSKAELDAYKQGRTHEIKKKKYYKSLIGGGQYDDTALEKSMSEIAINIRHMSDKVKLSNDAIDHHKLIVDTLTQQLEDYNKSFIEFTLAKEQHAAGNRLG